MTLPSGKISDDKTTAILGGGLAGLSAAHALTRAGRKALVLEASHEVGGLSRTIVSDGFRFDLGGHRFFTKDKDIDALVRDLMKGELVEVSRKSQIYLNGRLINYPLKPFNAISGMGLPKTLKIVADYGIQRAKSLAGNGRSVSLEDWVVGKFGRSLFNLYFKEYSEKVWGLDCSRISQSWVAKRITGLSLGRAIKDAFFGDGRDKVPSLVDRFLYPALGIGRISDRFREEIEKSNRVLTGSFISELRHKNNRISHAIAKNGKEEFKIDADDFISTIPLTSLVRALNPPPPEDVVEAAAMLGYRDLVVAGVIVNKKSVSDQSWIYIPEMKIPFGRIHEPKNWSPRMAPEDRTLLVIEYFCFKGDRIWNMPDGALEDLTVKHLEALGFLKRSDVEGAVIVRVPKAYPLFEVGYEDHCEKIYSYLSRFENLQAAGRSGVFKYLNMDHAIEAGIEAAEKVIGKSVPAHAQEALR